MKLAAITCIALLPFAAVAQDDAPELAPLSSLSVKCKETATSKAVVRNWETYYGSYDRDFVRDKDLEISVRNFSHALPAEFSLHVLFIARPQRGGDKFISERQIFEDKLAPGAYTSVKILSDAIEANDTKYAALGQRYTSGAKFAGWIVVANSAGKSKIMVRSGDLASTSESDVLEMLEKFQERTSSDETAQASQ